MARIEVLKDLEELKRLGVDTSKTISRVKSGDFDEDIELYDDCMMVRARRRILLVFYLFRRGRQSRTL